MCTSFVYVFTGVFGAGKSFLLSVYMFYLHFYRGVWSWEELPAVCLRVLFTFLQGCCELGRASCCLFTCFVYVFTGVFGAGKSFLLSVMIRFLVRVFEVNSSYTPGLPYPWKILISSTTNVAVDRVLMG
jgi:DNA replication protein DnaC